LSHLSHSISKKWSSITSEGEDTQISTFIWDSWDNIIFAHNDSITSKFFRSLSLLVLLIERKLNCSLVAYCVILMNCFLDIFGGHISSANFSTSLNAAGKNNNKDEVYDLRSILS